MMAGQLALQALNDPTIASTAVYPAYLDVVTAEVSVANTGSSGGAFTVGGILVNSGTTGPSQGHIGVPGNPTVAVAGSAAPGATAQVQLETGGITYWINVANYNTAKGLDILLTLTDTATGATTEYTIPSAIFMPTEPAELAVTSVVLGVIA